MMRSFFISRYEFCADHEFTENERVKAIVKNQSKILECKFGLCSNERGGTATQVSNERVFASRKFKWQKERRGKIKSHVYYARRRGDHMQRET